MKKAPVHEAFLLRLFLVIIGIGSALFHASQRRWAEYLDEIPILMFIMAANLCQRHTNLSIKRMNHFSKSVVAIISGSIISYGMFDIYAIFIAATFCFATSAIYLSLEVKSRHISIFVKAFATLGIVTSIWIWEQRLSNSSTCPTALTDPRYYLHAIWHLFSACALHWWSTYMELQIQDTMCLQYGIDLEMIQYAATKFTTAKRKPNPNVISWLKNWRNKIVSIFAK